VPPEFFSVCFFDGLILSWGAAVVVGVRVRRRVGRRVWRGVWSRRGRITTIIVGTTAIIVSATAIIVGTATAIVVGRTTAIISIIVSTATVAAV
jgi:hypothetical protein